MKNYTSSLYVLGKQITYSDNESKQLIKDAKQVTHEQLKQIRDKSTLIPGQWYRITDYVCTTVQEGTQSAGHPFDILVRADAADKLNETAYATLHKGDTYFANSKLEAWELKYTIDNDTTRFAWADSENGKGVIYYMKDEWDNECPYDFKNILYVFEEGFEYRKWGTTVKIKRNSSLDTEVEGTMYYGYTIQGTTKPYGWATYDCYTTYLVTNVSETLYDSPGGSQITGGDIITVYQESFLTYTFDSNNNDGSIEDSVYGNCILPYCKIIGNADQKPIKYYLLNTIYFRNSYRLTCYNNTFGSNCSYNVFGNDCNNNTFEDDCKNNTFGSSCMSNKFGNGCHNNTFGSSCGNNTFGDNCCYNTFGSSCGNNTFGSSCMSNKFGNGLSRNTFGNSCNSNTFGDGCSDNTFGSSCGSNYLQMYCNNNTFGSSCSYNTFGSNCSYNVFGNNCNNIIFGTDKDSPRSKYKNIIVESGNQKINLNCTQTIDSSKYFQNILISLGTYSSNPAKTINIDAVNQNYKTVVCTDSLGQIVTYIPGDAHHAQAVAD